MPARVAGRMPQPASLQAGVVAACSRNWTIGQAESRTPVSSLQPVVMICVHHARIYFTLTDSVEETMNETMRRLPLEET